MTHSHNIHAEPIDREAGFTIPELLVVLLIISILSAIFLPDFMTGLRTAGYDKHVIADTDNIAIKAGTYKVDYNKSPTSIAELPALKLKGEGNTFAIVTEGQITCILGSNQGSNYTSDAPYVAVMQGYVIDTTAKICPLIVTSAVWR